MITNLFMHPTLQMLQRSAHSLNPRFWSQAVRQILSYFKRKRDPVLLGEISLLVGLNLRQTEDLVTDLVERRLIRHCEAKEIQARPGSLGYMYLLTNPELIPLGDWDAISEALLGDPPVRLV